MTAWLVWLTTFFFLFSFFLPSRADVILQQIMQRCLPTSPPDFQTLYHSKREDNASSNASRHFRNTLREILGQFAISLDVSFICLSACEKNNCERKFKTIAAAYYVLFGRGTNRIENFMSCSCSLWIYACHFSIFLLLLLARYSWR